MSRTFRTIPHDLLYVARLERTWRGLGYTEPYLIESIRHRGANGYDGGTPDGRHLNTRRREKRALQKRDRHNHR